MKKSGELPSESHQAGKVDAVEALGGSLKELDILFNQNIELINAYKSKVASDSQAVEDFYPENPYMLWYYGPLKTKKSQWTPLYYDPYLQSEIITYAAPVYQNYKLLGVTGVDFLFEPIRIKSYERIREVLNSFSGAKCSTPASK